ncbi:hypothetical protein [Arsenophonus sp.]|uniref:hypothetical protein n=1 Tax=Arsenophonus sp. TaxID=1872640 RepID=UPI0028642234|nr:hypothetical protein [Arsenophonus sp.]MDR5617653.1 hypothetical protein [Arsenophonus sp.]
MALYTKYRLLILSIISILPLFFLPTAIASLEQQQKYYCTGTIKDKENKDMGEWDKFFYFNTSNLEDAMKKAKKQYEKLINEKSNDVEIGVDNCKIAN